MFHEVIFLPIFLRLQAASMVVLGDLLFLKSRFLQGNAILLPRIHTYFSYQCISETKALNDQKRNSFEGTMLI